MKKFLNYYLPVAIYFATFMFLFMTLFFIKRTPETSNLVVEYEKTVFNFLSVWVLLPLLGFAYYKYFFEILLCKINGYFFKRYVKKYEFWTADVRIEDKIKRSNGMWLFLSASAFVIMFVIMFVISLCI